MDDNELNKLIYEFPLDVDYEPDKYDYISVNEYVLDRKWEKQASGLIQSDWETLVREGWEVIAKIDSKIFGTRRYLRKPIESPKAD